jgi:photosystem II stability/assembly factor-like uncharacterized protein
LRSEYRLILLALLLTGAEVRAQEETVSMAILNSRKHRLGVSDNPLVGLFVSGDRGSTWEHRGWKEYIRTFYSETGSDGTLWSACGNGVLRSTDRGATWRVTTGWEVTEVLKVKVDPRSARRVAAATAYGMIVTADGGETWQTTTTGMEQTFCSDALWLPGRREVLLAATEDGVYRSVSGGKNWTRSGLTGKGVRVLTGGTGDKEIWAGTEDDGVFRSKDGGATWQPRGGGLAHRTVYALALHPTDPAVAYAGTYGGGVYRTTDGGGHWEQTSAGLTTMDVHALYVMRSDPSVVFAGTLNGGLFRSTDAGVSWRFDSQEDAQVWGLSGHVSGSGE